MKKKLALEDITLHSFVTSSQKAHEVKGGAPGPILITNNPTVFNQNCCSGFTCGLCAYPWTIPNPDCYEDP